MLLSLAKFRGRNLLCGAYNMNVQILFEILLESCDILIRIRFQLILKINNKFHSSLYILVLFLTDEGLKRVLTIVTI